MVEKNIPLTTDARGQCSFYDDVMLYQRSFFISLLLIATTVLVACSSSFNFQSEAQAPEDSGVPLPDIFGTEQEAQPSASPNNQSLINLLVLIAFGLVSLILLVMMGRR